MENVSPPSVRGWSARWHHQQQVAIEYWLQRRCMTKKRQSPFGPMCPFPWQWDTELQAKQRLVIEGVLFLGTLLKIDVICTITTPIIALMVRTKIGLLP